MDAVLQASHDEWTVPDALSLQIYRLAQSHLSPVRHCCHSPLRDGDMPRQFDIVAHLVQHESSDIMDNKKQDYVVFSN